MHDSNILAAAIASRAAFERALPHIDRGSMQATSQFWWDYVQDWYKNDPTAERVDLEILAARGKRAISNPKHEDVLMGYLADLPEAVSASNVVQEVIELKRYTKGNELAAAIAGRQPAAAIRALVEQYEALLSDSALTTDLNEVNDDDEMFEFLDRKNAIPLAPLKLNERAGGGAVPGDHIVIFGRPEAGKSLFCVNMAAGFLKTGHKTLYIGNEEDLRKTRMRILTNLANCTREQAVAEKAKALRLARDKGWEQLRMAQPDDASIASVVKLIEKHEPQVLVLDQIRGMTIDGPEGHNMTQKLSRLGIEVRAILKKYKLVGVSVTQANDRTERHGQEPPPWLDMADVDSSRTGLPAQADLLIGIGANNEMRMHNTRAISLPKNKLGMTHEPFTVEIDTLRSKVR
jgi:archaellum biogenesis ATPase FlaH